MVNTACIVVQVITSAKSCFTLVGQLKGAPKSIEVRFDFEEDTFTSWLVILG